MQGWLKPVLLGLGVLQGLVNNGLAMPAPDFQFDSALLSLNYSEFTATFGDLRVKRAGEVPLRILPLGASIMSGVGSSSGNGYVKILKLSLHAQLDTDYIKVYASHYGTSSGATVGKLTWSAPEIRAT